MGVKTNSEIITLCQTAVDTIKKTIQSEHDANVSEWLQVWENACVQNIGFGFMLIQLVEKVEQFFFN